LLATTKRELQLARVAVIPSRPTTNSVENLEAITGGFQGRPVPRRRQPAGVDDHSPGRHRRVLPTNFSRPGPPTPCCCKTGRQGPGFFWRAYLAGVSLGALEQDLRRVVEMTRGNGSHQLSSCPCLLERRLRPFRILCSASRWVSGGPGCSTGLKITGKCVPGRETTLSTAPLLMLGNPASSSTANPAVTSPTRVYRTPTLRRCDPGA